MSHPIENIVWVEAEELKANDYNPNHVMKQEMKLLELSIILNGWIQPILVTQDNIIIDGFHRATLGRASEGLKKKWGSKVPCVKMNLTEAERKLLTIRINRAKGTHTSYKVAEVIQSLIEEHGMNPKDVAKGIGATKAEIDLLLMKDVFEKHEVDKHPYSQAWYPNYGGKSQA